MNPLVLILIVILVIAALGGLPAVGLVHFGLFPSGILGLIAGGISLGLGQFAFASARSTAMRTAVAGLFTLPAGVAGYWSVYGVVQLCTASEGWRQAFAVAGAVTIVAISYGRLAAFAPLRIGRDARLA